MIEPDWTSDDGSVQLYRGDCLDILPHLGGVDAVVTDPPYGIGYGGSQSVGGTPGRKKAYWRTWKTGWDEARASKEAIRLLEEVSTELIVWGGNYYADMLAPSGGWLVWDKAQRGLTFGEGELAWTNAIKSLRIFSLNRCFVSIDGKEHPTQKPVALMEWCLTFIKGETVLDPFMGSATTGVACVRTGRKFIGVEIDKGYFEIAKQRIKKAIAEKAELLVYA